MLCVIRTLQFMYEVFHTSSLSKFSWSSMQRCGRRRVHMQKFEKGSSQAVLPLQGFGATSHIEKRFTAPRAHACSSAVWASMTAMARQQLCIPEMEIWNDWCTGTHSCRFALHFRSRAPFRQLLVVQLLRCPWQCDITPSAAPASDRRPICSLWIECSAACCATRLVRVMGGPAPRGIPLSPLGSPCSAPRLHNHRLHQRELSSPLCWATPAGSDLQKKHASQAKRLSLVSPLLPFHPSRLPDRLILWLAS
jgi:hypothetical protein